MPTPYAVSEGLCVIARMSELQSTGGAPTTGHSRKFESEHRPTPRFSHTHTLRRRKVVFGAARVMRQVDAVEPFAPQARQASRFQTY
jgi:hypothetical protein